MFVCVLCNLVYCWCWSCCFNLCVCEGVDCYFDSEWLSVVVRFVENSVEIVENLLILFCWCSWLYSCCFYFVWSCIGFCLICSVLCVRFVENSVEIVENLLIFGFWHFLVLCGVCLVCCFVIVLFLRCLLLDTKCSVYGFILCICAF